MKKLIFTFLVLTLSISAFSQTNSSNYQIYFNEAYQQNPTIPKGMLEAIAYTTTRINHINNETESCFGLPKVYGVMGLTLDGKNYFRNNLVFVSSLSGVSVQKIIDSPRDNILAYAKAYALLQNNLAVGTKIENQKPVLVALSELPYDSLQQDYALNTQLYQIYYYLSNDKFAQTHNFSKYQINYKKLFGRNINVLRAKKVIIKNNSIIGGNGIVYKKTKGTPNNKSIDYPPAIWDAANSSNYSSRNGVAISAVTIHTIQGSYAGAISWFKNPSANVSAHYVLRSSDGQVTQMVLESDKAWHVGNSNPSTIGLEHEGYVSNPAWYTQAMYQSSANLVKDITQSGYGINPIRTAYFPWTASTNYNQAGIPGSCVTIKGHQHFPNQTHTDPGVNWDWDYYYKLINSTTVPTTYTTQSGIITDSGGSSGNYSDDERQLILIQPTGASAINLTVNTFDLEATWDYLYIYDGATVFDTKIGEYTGTTIPSTITSTGGSLMIEFRSDCGTTAPGFEFSFSATIPDTIKPTTIFDSVPLVSTDFNVTFHDSDNVGGSGVQYQFYQVIDFDGQEWRANAQNGFFSDNFDNAIHNNWNTHTGTWSIVNGYLEQSNENLTNTNIVAPLNQNNFNAYLYHWQGNISGVGSNKRAGFHFMCDSDTLTNRGNSYFLWFRQDDGRLQFYKVINDTFQLQKSEIVTINSNQWYDVKVVFDKTTGEFFAYLNNNFISSWIDNNPHTQGDFISFRTGDSKYTINNLKVYHSRSLNELVTVGNSLTKDIRYENNPSNVSAGKVKSMVIDSAHNISSIYSQLIDVDWNITNVTAINNESIYTVYPNPFNNSVFIQSSNAKLGSKVNYRLLNYLGQEIFNNQIIVKSNHQKLILPPYIESGVYLLKLSFNEEEQNIKLIKR